MLIREKVRQAIDLLKEYDIDCWLTFVRESSINRDPVLPFLLDADVTWHSAVIIASSGDTLAIVGQYDKATVEDLDVYGRVIGYVEGIKADLLDVLKKWNPSKIAVNWSVDSEVCDGLTHGMYLTLRTFLAEIGFQNRLISAESIVSALRQRKTGYELEAIVEAIRATEEIFSKVHGFIEPGKTEEEIAAFMKGEAEAARLELAWAPKVCPSVFTGPETAGAHYAPTDRVVEPGHILNMDFGVKVRDYCSDMQRTFYVLEPGESTPPQEVQKGFDTIVQAIERAKERLEPGVQGLEVDGAARQCVVDAGYEAFPHGLGHQVGRFAHDGTALLGPAWEKYGKKPFEKIEEDMVFTLEPRLTVEGRGVATIEEMVVVTREGSSYLSTPQKTLLLVRS